MRLEEKINIVKEKLKDLKEVCIAFSGGKDSFFLLKQAVETLGKKNVTAFFVKTDFITKNDEKRVDYFKNILDFKLKKTFIDLFKYKNILSNPKDRCYFCKKKIFSTLKKEALKLKIKNILDGTTYSDLNEYRPGLKALEELKIVSPLRDAAITSDEVVEFLRELEIKNFYLTSSTCLATRFPYDFNLNKNILRKFDMLELFFVENGIYPIKIRFIPDGIRIETKEENFKKILKIRKKIINICKNNRIKLITLDIEGIKTGIWD